MPVALFYQPSIGCRCFGKRLSPYFEIKSPLGKTPWKASKIVTITFNRGTGVSFCVFLTSSNDEFNFISDILKHGGDVLKFAGKAVAKNVTIVMKNNVYETDPRSLSFDLGHQFSEESKLWIQVTPNDGQSDWAFWLRCLWLVHDQASGIPSQVENSEFGNSVFVRINS